jgi:hypothetical protein
VSIVDDKTLRAGSLESADLKNRILIDFSMAGVRVQHRRVESSRVEHELLTLLIADAIPRRHAVREKTSDHFSRL